MINNIRVDLSVVDEFLRLTPRNIENAQRSAVRRATTAGGKLIRERMRNLHPDLPAKVFNQYRVNYGTRLAPGSQRLEQGRIFHGYNAVRAIYAGKLQAVRDGSIKGAFAGRYFFKGAFIIKAANGKELLVYRAGHARAPLKNATIDLQSSVSVVGAAVAEVSAMHRQFFITKLIEYDSRIMGG